MEWGVEGGGGKGRIMSSTLIFFIFLKLRQRKNFTVVDAQVHDPQTSANVGVAHSLKGKTKQY